MKALKFTGLNPGEHTWYEDDTQSEEPSSANPAGYPGPVIRVNPGDIVPIEKLHKAGHFSVVDVRSNFLERGLAVEVDIPDTKPSAKAASAASDAPKS